MEPTKKELDESAVFNRICLGEDRKRSISELAQMTGFSEDKVRAIVTEILEERSYVKEKDGYVWQEV